MSLPASLDLHHVIQFLSNKQICLIAGKIRKEREM